ncbi:MAG TPA: N-acetyl-D-Glu racemase DgcA, partial [Arenibaculum sp.]|nr:N-acetyl-D-Glu racemase DgcA [Arenibaculum sp.]
GARNVADVVVADITDGSVTGRGECVPYPRYGESIEQSMAEIAAMADAVSAGMDRGELQRRMPPGAARNALDCAFWDLEAKLTGVPVWQAAELDGPPGPVVTAFTISVDTPEGMAAATRDAVGKPLLKVKLAGDGDLERMRAVREAAPGARLIADANEAWTVDHLHRFAPAYADLGVELIEQPFPAGDDDPLLGFRSPVPIGADESCHSREELEACKGKYRVLNLKLDKTGGLTEALELKRAALAAGFDLMVGCMVGSSLAMAPAMYVAQGVRFVDLDGPLLLAADREPGLRFDGATVHPPDPALWG